MSRMLLVPAAALLIGACSSSPSGPIPEPVMLELTGPDSVAVGDTARFAAHVLDVHGEPIVQLPIAWNLDSQETAEDLGQGRFHALAVGTATVHASWGRMSESAELVVFDKAAMRSASRRRGGQARAQD